MSQPLLGQKPPRAPVMQSTAWLVTFVIAGVAELVVFFASFRDIIPDGFSRDAKELFVFGWLGIGVTLGSIGFTPRTLAKTAAMAERNAAPGEEPAHASPRFLRLLAMLLVGSVGVPAVVALIAAYLIG